RQGDGRARRAEPRPPVLAAAGRLCAGQDGRAVLGRVGGEGGGDVVGAAGAVVDEDAAADVAGGRRPVGGGGRGGERRALSGGGGYGMIVPGGKCAPNPPSADARTIRELPCPPPPTRSPRAWSGTARTWRCWSGCNSTPGCGTASTPPAWCSKRCWRRGA